MAEKNKDLDLDGKKPLGAKKQIAVYVIMAALLVALSVTSTLLYVKTQEGRVKEEEKPEVKPAIYLPLDTMVVNFGGKGRSRYLQVDMQLMTHEESVIEAVQTHMPIIRNDILLLLSSQTSDAIGTLEGKAKLRAEILAAIQTILIEQAALRGEEMTANVEGVYFTSFVMQ